MLYHIVIGLQFLTKTKMVDRDFKKLFGNCNHHLCLCELKFIALISWQKKFNKKQLLKEIKPILGPLRTMHILITSVGGYALQVIRYNITFLK